jgi:hypothetical protein
MAATGIAFRETVRAWPAPKRRDLLTTCPSAHA